MGLYDYPVLFNVYRTRCGGIRMTDEEIAKWGAVHGDLELRGRGRGNHLATLQKPGTPHFVIPCMDAARVTRVTPAGMLIVGTEVIPGRGIKSRSHYFPQSWWCVPA